MEYILLLATACEKLGELDQVTISSFHGLIPLGSNTLARGRNSTYKGGKQGQHHPQHAKEVRNRYLETPSSPEA